MSKCRMIHRKRAPVATLPAHRTCAASDRGAGVEQDGTPLLLRLPAPDVAHVLITGHYRFGQDRTGTYLAHVTDDVQPPE